MENHLQAERATTLTQREHVYFDQMTIIRSIGSVSAIPIGIETGNPNRKPRSGNGTQTETARLMDNSFMGRGPCLKLAGSPDYDFFPEKGEASPEVKAVCEACPVRRQCEDFGWQQPRDDRTVYNGLSMVERRRIRDNTARRAIKKSQTPKK